MGQQTVRLQNHRLAYNNSYPSKGTRTRLTYFRDSFREYFLFKNFTEFVLSVLFLMSSLRVWGTSWLNTNWVQRKIDWVFEKSLLRLLSIFLANWAHFEITKSHFIQRYYESPSFSAETFLTDQNGVNWFFRVISWLAGQGGPEKNSWEKVEKVKIQIIIFESR